MPVDSPFETISKKRNLANKTTMIFVACASYGAGLE